MTIRFNDHFLHIRIKWEDMPLSTPYIVGIVSKSRKWYNISLTFFYIDILYAVKDWRTKDVTIIDGKEYLIYRQNHKYTMEECRTIMIPKLKGEEKE